MPELNLKSEKKSAKKRDDNDSDNSDSDDFEIEESGMTDGEDEDGSLDFEANLQMIRAESQLVE